MFEVTYFASNLLEARIQPKIYLKGHTLPFITPPKLTGVTLGRELSAGYYLANITTKAVGKYRLPLGDIFPKQPA